MTLGPEFWNAIREGKGSTISEQQKHLEEAVRKQKHFVSHEGRFEMLSVNEVEIPEESTGEVYERYCTSCEMTIPLVNWLNHVKTQYHQIKFKTKVALLGFCWYKQPNINVHDPSDCSECMKRMQLNRNYCDKLENIKEYRQGEDEEFLEMQKDIKEVEKVLNKYNCELCNVKCHTEGYFSNHLKGRKHKLKASEKEFKDCKKRKSEATDNATPQSSQKKNENTGKRKGSETESSETKPKKKNPSSDDDTHDCIRKLGIGEYKCVYCDLTLKYKRNINSHLKTKKHLNAKKHSLSTTDESIHPDRSARNNLQELSFVRDGGYHGGDDDSEENRREQKSEENENKKKGNHFMIEFSKPVKYKIAQRVKKCLFSCEVCLKTFITHGAYRRHCVTSQHIQKKKLKMYGTRKRQSIVKRKEKMQSLVDQLAASNEFSETRDMFPFSHTHLYLKSKDKFFFKDIKKLLKKTCRGKTM